MESPIELGWTSTIRKDITGDPEKNIYLHKSFGNAVDPPHPLLLISCFEQPNNYDPVVYIQWERYIVTQQKDVHFGMLIGDEDFSDIPWTLDQNMPLTYYESNSVLGDSVALVQKMIAAEGMVVHAYPPYRENNYLVYFDLTGLESAMADNKKHCKM